MTIQLGRIRGWVLVLISCLAAETAFGFSGTLAQENYRWRNDDGSETGATWKAAANTAITGVQRGQNIRLRFSVRETTGGAYSASVSGSLQYSTSAAGPWTTIGTNDLSAFKMTATSQYTSGAPTTAQLGSGTFTAGKCVEAPVIEIPAVSIAPTNYSNFEFCFQPTAKAPGNAKYYFQISGLSTYTRRAELTMAAGEANEPPVIRSPVTAQGSVVAPFSYAIQASGSEPISYSAGGLPAGLSLVSTNMITGMPAAAGIYSIGLAASNAWGTSAKTLALTVLANQPPVASNQTAVVVERGETMICLVWSDPDTPDQAAHSFTILSGPSKGTLQSYNERNNTTAYPGLWYYRAAEEAGTDSFSWKCRDADNDSNLATCTINVTTNARPTASSSTSSVNTYTRSAVYLSWDDPDSGQTYTTMPVSGPSHGKLEMPPTASSWYYTSDPEFTGTDSFQWRVSDGVATSGVATVTITVSATTPVASDQTAVIRKDTPTDIPASFTGGGSGSTTILVYQTPLHGSLSFSGTTFRYTPTAGYTGPDQFRWRIGSGGPIVTCSIWVKEIAGGSDWPQWRCDEYRTATTAMSLPLELHLQWRRDLPPVRPIKRELEGCKNACIIDQAYMPIVLGQTMFVSFNRDDCVAAYDTRTGAEKWRFPVNGPVRVAPVAYRLQQGEERVCVASDDGWLYCLSAGDGSLKWKIRCGPGDRKLFGEERLISVWPVRGGPTYYDGKIIFAGGVWPVEGCFLWAVDADTGAKIWRNDRLGTYVAGSGPYHYEENGLWGLMPYGYPVKRHWNSDEFYLPSGDVRPARFSFADGNWLSEGPSMTYYDQVWWYVSTDGAWARPSPYLVAGTRSFASEDLAALGVSGSIDSILAADDRLFTVTSQGSIYCFGGTQVPTPTLYSNHITPLLPLNDAWSTNMAAILSSTGVNDKGIGMVWGIGSGRAMEEMVKLSALHVVGIDSNAATVRVLRAKLQNAGLYGERCAVLEADPMSLDLPPYQAWVLVVENLEGSGFGIPGREIAFVKKLFNVVRPYGGRAWLPLGLAEHEAFQGWVASAGLSNATVLRSGNWTVLERTGALAGALEFTAAGGTINKSDALAKAPFGVSWYGNSPILRAANPAPGTPDVTGGRIVKADGDATDVYTGIAQTTGWTYSGGKSVQAPVPGLSNPFYDTGFATGSSGSGLYGAISIDFVGAVGYSDRRSDAGITYWGGLSMSRQNISAQGVLYREAGMIPANGMFTFALMYGSCSCFPGIMQAIGLYHREDVESWTSASRMIDRTTATVEDRPIRKVGINFGAPASRVADDNVLWLEIPRHQPGSEPSIATFLTPAQPEAYYHHSGWIGGESSRKWVAASGVKNLSRVDIRTSHAVTALPVDATPVIDGNLGDACWDGQSATRMTWSQRKGLIRIGYGADGAVVMARYDSDNLYVMMDTPYVNCDGGKDKFILSLLNREQLGRDDTAIPVSFTVTRAGTIQVSGGIMGSWTNDWSGAYATDTNSVRCEIALPWHTLKAAGLWLENLVVNMKWDTGTVTGSGYNSWIGQVLRHDGYCPLYVGGLKGLGGQVRPYNVKLYFAETEGAAAGERVFNVKLQGSRVLTNLDVAGEAGGADLALVKEYTGIGVSDRLAVELENVTGQTMLSGVELVGTWNDSDYPNQGPVAKIQTDVVSGTAPLAVTLDARNSQDPDGQIVDCWWDCGDGAVKKGSIVTHVFTEPGTYVVRLTVLDERGETGFATATVTVGAGVPAAFVCRIRASGGDYAKLTAWEAAIRSDLTSQTRIFTVSDTGTYTNSADNMKTVTFSGGGSGLLRWIDTNATPKVAAVAGCKGTIEAGIVTNGSTTHWFSVADSGRDAASLLFAVLNRGTYNPSTDDGREVTFSGGGKGYLRHLNTEGIAFITECRGDCGAGVAIVDGGHTFEVSGAGSPIYTAVAECYNDWPATGLSDSTLNMSGWFTDANRCVAIRAAPGHGHKGVIKDGSGSYTGFALRNASGAYGINAAPWTRITDIILDASAVPLPYEPKLSVSSGGAINRVIARNATINAGSGGTAANIISIDRGFVGATNSTAYYNCTAVDAAACFVNDWSAGHRTRFVNCLARPKNGGVGFSFSGTPPMISYCASSDGTADNWTAYGEGRELNRADVVFSFVSETNDDFRLAGNDTGAHGWGTTGWGADIEGQIRQAPYDIGADEVAGAGDWDLDGMPDLWEAANGFNQLNSADAAQDADGDGMTNLDEYRAGTNPRDAGSVCRLSGASCQGGATDFVLQWQSVAGKYYTIQCSTNLLNGFGGVVTNRIPASAPVNVHTVKLDRVAQKYYRIVVE